jgi:hypothetical protein
MYDQKQFGAICGQKKKIFNILIINQLGALVNRLLIG